VRVILAAVFTGIARLTFAELVDVVTSLACGRSSALG
jgi:hypothetical protein